MASHDPVHDRIRAALEAFTGRTWRWGQGVVREISIDDVNTASVHRARLDTLIESRLERRLTRPAQEGDQPAQQQPSRAVSLWEVPLEVPMAFDNAATAVALPGSDHPCTCDLCMGEQTVMCLACAETGLRRAKRRCKQCDGIGRTRCSACEGSGRIIDWSCIEVLWRHDARYAVDCSLRLEDRTWLACEGQELARAEGGQLSGDEVARALEGTQGCDGVFAQRAHDLLASVPTAGGRVARQRLSVHRIEVHAVRYRWKGDPGRCMVVGDGGIVQGNDLPLRRAYASRALSGTLDVLASWAQRAERRSRPE